ncbi:MAG: hypothetical protein JXA22_02315 [Candidatus Thermoplasmatota archaeon]|nr:hypothetical protein [Candidatus Thermoplasmatota archaeon]
MIMYLNNIRIPFYSCLLMVSLLILSICMKDVKADPPVTDMAIIIVSDYEGYDSIETNKALAYFDHLTSTSIDEENIFFLCSDGVPGQDFPANISNVHYAFEELAKDNCPNKDIYLYISDSAHGDAYMEYYQFIDGNICRSEIEYWLDSMMYSNLHYISLGNRSGSIGSTLVDTTRTIISSMGPNDDAEIDLFNITRSLIDPDADLNDDGSVSYIEAFYSEEAILEQFYQYPILWT